MNLLLVRHGETVSNIKKVYAGKSSESLTRRGEIQAKKVAKKLKSYEVHAVYSSPVQRAIQTAKIIGEVIGVDFIIEKAFQEMDLGHWEGLSEKNIIKLYPKKWQIWLRSPAELKLPDRETLKELLHRVLIGVQRIYQSSGNKNIVVVTHVAVIRTLLLWHAKKDLNLYKTIHVPNAKVFNIKINSYPHPTL